MSKQKDAVYFYSVAKTNSKDGSAKEDIVFHLHGFPWAAPNDEQAVRLLQSKLDTLTDEQAKEFDPANYSLFRLFEYRGYEKYPVVKDFRCLGRVSKLCKKKGTKDGE